MPPPPASQGRISDFAQEVLEAAIRQVQETNDHQPMVGVNATLPDIRPLTSAPSASSAADKPSVPPSNPQAYFLPGRKDQEGEERVGHVSIKTCFDSPETHADCCGFLRKACPNGL